jgi:hypothetical protein
MSQAKRAGRVATVLWSIGIGIAVLACGISVLLPSTKRSRIKFDQLHRTTHEAAATQSAPATGPVADEPRAGDTGGRPR